MKHTKQSFTRAEIVRQRRQQSRKRISRTAQRAYRQSVKYPPITMGTGRVVHTNQPVNKQPRRRELAFSLGNAEVRAPGLSLPRFSPRWISALLTAALIYAIYALWTSPAFVIQNAEIVGNIRLDAAEINGALQLTGQPVFMVEPEKIEEALPRAFHELSRVDVQVMLPARISITVEERIPIIAWYEEGRMTWIDTEGIAFLPRGEAANLISVIAKDAPPSLPIDPEEADVILPYISPEIVRAIATLYPYVPTLAAIVYDPLYGLGWQDNRGWMVYFGESIDDIPTKLMVYQSIIDQLEQDGIQPSLISIEHLDAPYYRIQQ